MPDRAQMGPTPVRPVLTVMGVVIGVVVAGQTTVAARALVAALWIAVVWWRPLAEVVGDD